MRKPIVIGILGIALALAATLASGSIGQDGGDIEKALRLAVDKINLKVDKLGPATVPSAEQWEEMTRAGWIPKNLAPLRAMTVHSARGSAWHMTAGVSVTITRAENAAEALAYLRAVTDHRRTQLAAGLKPFGGWTGKIEMTDFQACRASRATLIDKSFDENDPPRTEWLSWVQGPLLVEFVVNSRAKEPDFGLEGSAYVVWKELKVEGF